ncbi:MAG: tRNA (N6-threonylcarbamoyladenosine(37)-N6)-methyltransferase TrmO [Opitutaceae bacterium]
MPNPPEPPFPPDEPTAPAPAELTLRPIGFVRTGKRVKFAARHQPEETQAETNVVELLPGRDLELALRDLAGFSRVWLIWWFHRNPSWRPLVLPPRGPAQRRGVFATRSPHRPNPIGLTPVQLLEVRKSSLVIGPCDLVDGTPIFDLKPYIPAYDAFPEATAGWLDDVDAALAAPPAFTVELEPLAAEQLAWLKTTCGVDFLDRLTDLLARDPTPHRARRIRRRQSGVLEIGCGAWRAQFAVEGTHVRVTLIEPAYPKRFLIDPARPGIPDGAAQLAFLERWPELESGPADRID